MGSLVGVSGSWFYLLFLGLRRSHCVPISVYFLLVLGLFGGLLLVSLSRDVAAPCRFFCLPGVPMLLLLTTFWLTVPASRLSLCGPCASVRKAAHQSQSGWLDLERSRRGQLAFGFLHLAPSLLGSLSTSSRPPRCCLLRIVQLPDGLLLLAELPIRNLLHRLLRLRRLFSSSWAAVRASLSQIGRLPVYRLLSLSSSLLRL